MGFKGGELLGIFDEEIFHIVLFGTLTPTSCQTPTKLFSRSPRQQDGVRNYHHRQNRNDFGENEFYCHLKQGWMERNQDKNKDTALKPSFFPGSASCLPSRPLQPPPARAGLGLGLCRRLPAPPCRSLSCSSACPPGLQGNLCAWSRSCPPPALPRLTSVAPRHRGAPLCPAGPGAGWDRLCPAWGSLGPTLQKPCHWHCTYLLRVNP